MDCCNFMPYRPPVYYGNPYYENLPYPGDYYGHPYQDYYGNSHYYSQPWQCAAPFTDYVYNPKEARIRKAMREASRDRALGITPMSSPRGARRPNTWNFAEEEHMMMNSPHGMRGIIGTPMCSSPEFPIPTTGSGSFMQSMHYNKHMHPMPHTSNGYMQASINQIQQPEIWHPYEESIRNAPTGPYMIPPQMQAYQSRPDIPPQNVLSQEKPKLEPQNFNTEDTHTNENVPPNVVHDKIIMSEPVFENKVDNIQPLIETGNNVQAPEPFMPMYSDNIMQQTCHYEKNNDVKMKKVCSINPPFWFRKFTPRLQNPIHPYEMIRQGVNRNVQNLDNRYQKEYIRKYLENSEYDTMEIIMDANNVNNCFPYVTYPHPHSYNTMNHYINDMDLNHKLFMENCGTLCNDCGSEALNLSKTKCP